MSTDRAACTAERVMLLMAAVCFFVWGLEYAAALIFGA